MWLPLINWYSQLHLVSIRPGYYSIYMKKQIYFLFYHEITTNEVGSVVIRLGATIHLPSPIPTWYKSLVPPFLWNYIFELVCICVMQSTLSLYVLPLRARFNDVIQILPFFCRKRLLFTLPQSLTVSFAGLILMGILIRFLR
jgi:hypothetical protein